MLSENKHCKMYRMSLIPPKAAQYQANTPYAIPYYSTKFVSYRPCGPKIVCFLAYCFVTTERTNFPRSSQKILDNLDEHIHSLPRADLSSVYDGSPIREYQMTSELEDSEMPHTTVLSKD